MAAHCTLAAGSATTLCLVSSRALDQHRTSTSRWARFDGQITVAGNHIGSEPLAGTGRRHGHERPGGVPAM